MRATRTGLVACQSRIFTVRMVRNVGRSCTFVASRPTTDGAQRGSGKRERQRRRKEDATTCPERERHKDQTRESFGTLVPSKSVVVKDHTDETNFFRTTAPICVMEGSLECVLFLRPVQRGLAFVVA